MGHDPREIPIGMMLPVSVLRRRIRRFPLDEPERS